MPVQICRTTGMAILYETKTSDLQSMCLYKIRTFQINSFRFLRVQSVVCSDFLDSELHLLEEMQTPAKTLQAMNGSARTFEHLVG